MNIKIITESAQLESIADNLWIQMNDLLPAGDDVELRTRIIEKLSEWNKETKRGDI